MRVKIGIYELGAGERATIRGAVKAWVDASTGNPWRETRGTAEDRREAIALGVQFIRDHLMEHRDGFAVHGAATALHDDAKRC